MKKTIAKLLEENVKIYDVYEDGAIAPILKGIDAAAEAIEKEVEKECIAFSDWVDDNVAHFLGKYNPHKEGGYMRTTAELYSLYQKSKS